MNPAIAVTGIGLATPLGCSREATWTKIKHGRSAVQEAPDPDLEPELSALARPAPFRSPPSSHRIFPLALSACIEALADARLDLTSLPPERVGCSVSASKPVLVSAREVLPPDSVGRHLAQKLAIAGPFLNAVAACATGVHSIQAACRWLGEGACDAVLAGSVESSLSPLVVSGFRRMGVLSPLPRPFDRRRDGFLLAEGAGIFVLERRADARARGARLHAEIAACALGADASHPAHFSADGGSVSAVLARLLRSAGCSPADVDYVNLHGTGTRLNDPMETRAVKAAFGKEAYGLTASSTKAATGHLLGAAGSAEAAISCLALRDQFAPPTLHWEQPDPECDLDVTPKRGKPLRLRSALSLSFGFGGPIGAVLFLRP